MSVSKSVDFWQSVIDRYYKKYQKIHDTHMAYIKTATTTGKIVSPFGREYIYTPKQNWRGDTVWSEPDITNWPNQGCGADVMAVARVACYQRLQRAGIPLLKLISTVHDSIVADVAPQYVEQTGVIFDQVFRDLPRLVEQAYGVPWNIPMLGEVSVGPNMLELTEVKM